MDNKSILSYNLKMLNIFPELLAYGLLATFILRITIGYIFIAFGYRKIISERKEGALFFEKLGFKPGIAWVWLIGLIELLGGIAIFVGVYTQIVAMVLALIMLIAVFLKIKNKDAFPNALAFYVLIFIVTLSLLFTGAGLFAIDLPLL